MRMFRTLGLLTTVALAACNGVATGNSSTVQNTLYVTRAGTGSGTVVSTPAGITCGSVCDAPFDAGSVVTLTASPDASSTFSGWSGCDSTTGTTCTVTMTDILTVTATFDAAQVNDDLTVNLGGSGGGSVSDGVSFTCSSASCTQSYTDGTMVTLTATPDASSTFTGWSGCDSTTADVCTVTLFGATTVTATFAANTTEISNLSVVPQLQSLSVTWTNPTAPSFDHANLYVSGPGASGTTPQSVTGNSSDVSGLMPGETYTVTVTAVDTSGTESTGMTTSATTACTGDVGDWSVGQSAFTLQGALAFMAWSSETTGDVYVGTTASIPTGAELWLAIDTDGGGTGGDLTGQAVFSDTYDWDCTATGLCSAGSADITWPFNADIIVAFGTDGSIYTWTAADPVTGDGNGHTIPKWTTATAVDTASGGPIDEWGVNLSALGVDSSHAHRYAFAVVDPTTGHTTDFAPASSTATDVTGYFASLTSSFEETIFGTGWQNSLNTTVDAPSLVTITFDAPSAVGPLRIMGSIHPLSDALTDSSYQLDNPRGTSTYEGVFNFGGSVANLYFALTDGGTPEAFLGNSKDRVYTLSGRTETLPQLTFGTSYDSTHGYSIDFLFTDDGTQGTPLEIDGNVAALGGFTPGAGAPITLVSTNLYDAQVAFVAGVDPTASAIQWLIGYQGGTLEATPSGVYHSISDDVIDSVVLQWTARDGSYW